MKAIYLMAHFGSTCWVPKINQGSFSAPATWWYWYHDGLMNLEH